MLLFARLVVWVGEFLPEDSKFTRHFCLVFSHNDCKQKVIEWHRTELEKLDLWYRLQQDSLRLVAAREEAIAKGIGPMDPRYPNIFDFSGIAWKEEGRVHADILDRYKKTGAERMRRLDEAIRNYPQERVDAVTQACRDALKPEK
ncbi:MAG: hypothetical protein NUV90_02145 [Candidatus Parcubacteria bacterium]|nr:hypothetical protein [Candidatus Parcubacteria bacterium]